MIQAENLAKLYQRKPVLAGVNLSVHPGELVILQGANGVGKTTLIRILATLTRPSSGDFSIGGFSGLKEPELVRKQIGVMLHQPMVYGDLTAMENLNFFASLAGLKDQSSGNAALLEQMGLDPKNSKLVRNYSRGMQQRLSIARALIGNPPTLLMDEPFTGLDSANQERFIGLLCQLRSQGKAILLSDHDLFRASQIASRVDYLYRGKITSSFSGEE
ncbi:ABC transporter ATP-binding protein, partial [bacterium]|nr:ABC transporter ATP-binding protein [bacterium]